MSRHPSARLAPMGRELPYERVGGGMQVADSVQGRGEGPPARSELLLAPLTLQAETGGAARICARIVVRREAIAP